MLEFLVLFSLLGLIVLTPLKNKPSPSDLLWSGNPLPPLNIKINMFLFQWDQCFTRNENLFDLDKPSEPGTDWYISTMFVQFCLLQVSVAVETMNWDHHFWWNKTRSLQEEWREHRTTSRPQLLQSYHWQLWRQVHNWWGESRVNSTLFSNLLLYSSILQNISSC